MKRCAAIAISLVGLAGCAGSSGSIGLNQLERQAHQHDSRRLPYDFVKIQRAVFKHQAACDSDAVFSVEPSLPTYARISKPFSPGATTVSETLVLGLTLMRDLTVKADLFSYYTPTKAQINQMYNIVLRPELCPGQEGADERHQIEAPTTED